MIRGHAQMTSAKFSEFWTPSLPLSIPNPHNLPSFCQILANPLPPPEADVICASPLVITNAQFPERGCSFENPRAILFFLFLTQYMYQSLARITSPSPATPRRCSSCKVPMRKKYFKSCAGNRVPSPSREHFTSHEINNVGVASPRSTRLQNQLWMRWRAES